VDPHANRARCADRLRGRGGVLGGSHPRPAAGPRGSAPSSGGTTGSTPTLRAWRRRAGSPSPTAGAAGPRRAALPAVAVLEPAASTPRRREVEQQDRAAVQPRRELDRGEVGRGPLLVAVRHDRARRP